MVDSVLIFTKYNIQLSLYVNVEKGTAVLSGTFLLFADAVISHQGYLNQCFQNHWTFTLYWSSGLKYFWWDAGVTKAFWKGWKPIQGFPSPTYCYVQPISSIKEHFSYFLSLRKTKSALTWWRPKESRWKLKEQESSVFLIICCWSAMATLISLFYKKPLHNKLIYLAASLILRFLLYVLGHHLLIYFRWFKHLKLILS